MSPHECLEREVTKFRAWADTLTSHFGEWDTYYPDWADLYRACTVFLSAPPDGWSIAGINLLLYAIARDNECTVIVDAATPEQLLALSRAALHSAERDAKWQLAVRLAEFPGLPETESLLRSFANDADEYVRRRALMALADVGSPATEDLVERAWETGEQYQRMACLHALYTVGSPLLDRFLDLAELDAREYLLRAARRIRNREGEYQGRKGLS